MKIFFCFPCMHSWRGYGRLFLYNLFVVFCRVMLVLSSVTSLLSFVHICVVSYVSVVLYMLRLYCKCEVLIYKRDEQV